MNSIVLLMNWTGLSDDDRNDMLCMGQMRLRNLRGINDEQTRFGLVPVWKMLTDGRKLFDLIPTAM